MALDTEDHDKTEHDKFDSELSAHSYCNGLLAPQSDGGIEHSASRRETAHDWEDYKTMDKDFFDDGTITFFWYVHDTLLVFVFVLKRQIYDLWY